MIKKNHQQIGFSLLEVLIAMTLLSIMVVLLFSSLKIAAESWNKGETKISEVNEKAVVYQFFKRHLPSIKPLWDDFSEQEPVFSFKGDRDTLQFVSEFPASAERKGLQLFDIVYDNDKKIIKVLLKPFYPELDDQEWTLEQVTLLEQVESFSISYFSIGENETVGFWTDSWQDKEYLPALIKIKILLTDKSDWPEMIFALKLSLQQDDSDAEE